MEFLQEQLKAQKAGQAYAVLTVVETAGYLRHVARRGGIFDSGGNTDDQKWCYRKTS